MFEAVVLGVCGVVLQQGAVADPASEFKTALAQAQESVQRGSFERADKQLKELLGRHEKADYARLRASEIVELSKRCAFRREQGEPKLAELVSGELVRYEARTGDLEIRYVPGRVDDFISKPMIPGTLLQHRAVFAGPYVMEIECDAGSGGGFSGRGPRVYVGLGTDETLLVCFGTHVKPSEVALSYTPPQILRVRGEAQEVVDRHEKPAAAYDKPFELKVVVAASSVTAYRDGKRLLQAKRASKDFGHVAFSTDGGFERCTLKGKIQPSWPQGLLDVATQKALEAFDKKWKPKDVLPAWLFEAVAAPRGDDEVVAGAVDALRSVLGGSFASRSKEVEALSSKRSMAEMEGEWKKLVDAFPREPGAWVSLAFVQLRLGRPEAAQATCDAALSAGISSGALEPLPRMLLQSRTGPQWTRVFSYESAHYVVKSDIDREVCIEATKVLEESYRSYRIRLAPVPSAESRKFQVFLFSGQSGYLDYARDTLLVAPASTAGLYSPVLKQLLIWNLPDRDAMFLTVRHEGFHQYLDRLADAPPIWLNEGLAEYYEIADLYGGEWKEGQAHSLHVRRLTGPTAKWVPLRSLLDMDIRTFQSGDMAQLYGQSWALVHYLRQGPKDAQETFKKFWSAVIGGKSQEAATQEAFGDVDFAALEEAVRSHVRKLAG